MRSPRLSYLILGLVLIGSVGCSDPSEQALEDVDSSLIVVTSKSHISHRLGFRLNVPPGWYVLEGYTDWEMGFPPLRGAPPFDTINSPDGAHRWILVGRQPVQRGALTSWIGELRRTETITYPDLCDPPEYEIDALLDREPARVLGLRCPNDSPASVALQILALHQRWGYLVMCFSEEGAKGGVTTLKNDCSRWTSSFRFLD